MGPPDDPLDAITVRRQGRDDILTCPIFRDLARAYLGRSRTRAQLYIRSLIPGPDIQALPFHQDQTILKSPLVNVGFRFWNAASRAPGLE